MWVFMDTMCACVPLVPVASLLQRLEWTWLGYLGTQDPSDGDPSEGYMVTQL